MREIRLPKRHQSGVEITPDEQQQKRHRTVIIVGDGVNHGQREVNSQRHFCVGNPAGLVLVGFLRERAFLSFNPELWGARKLSLLPHDSFDHRLRVAHGNTDACGHYERHVEECAPPRFWPQFPLRNQVKARNRARGRQKERQVYQQHLEPALLKAHDHHRQQHRGEHNHKRIADVGREVKKGFGFYVPRYIRLENFWQDFLGRLHQSFGPARLLRFEAVHVHGQLGGAFNLRQIEEFPAFELRAIRKVRVFGQRIVLPAAGIVNHFAAPHARRAVEIEKCAPPGTRAVLHHEVPVEQNRFHVGQQRIIAVQVGPARLHHADVFAAVGVQEIRNRAAEKIRLGNEVRVKNRHESALRRFQAVFQRASLVSVAIRSMDVSDRHALRSVALHARARNVLRFVGGIVQNLNLQQLPRIVETRDSFRESLNDIALIENWQLHGHARPVCDRWRRRRDIFRILKIVVDQPVAMQPVHGEHEKHDEVGNHQGQVEGVGVINAAEGFVREFVPVMADGALEREKDRDCRGGVQDTGSVATSFFASFLANQTL